MKRADQVEVVGVPTAVADRLATIHGRAGVLDAAEVLADAQSSDSPLHGYFEWDDTAAAEAHRLAQANDLIRRVHVRVIAAPDSAPIRVRAYIANRDLPTSVERDEGGPPGRYTSIQDVARRSSYQAAVAESIRRDLARLQVKYSSTELFFSVAREWATDAHGRQG